MFEIGNTLREARLRRGWDLTRCETDTKIRSKYLRAMEDEQFDLLPAPTYVRGFLRSYAEHLGLDWQLVLDEYESRFGAFSDPSWDAERHPGRRAARRRRPAQERRSPEARLLWLALGGVMSVALLVWLGVGSPSQEVTPVPTATPPATTTTAPQEALVVRIAGTGVGSDVVVRARAAGGRVVFADRLDAGEAKTYRVQRSLWIQVDDPAGVQVSVNGTVRSVGAPGGYLVTSRGLRAQTAG
ncbi:MAG: RodZ domain-containing protein [Actinomycetota bacterium]